MNYSDLLNFCIQNCHNRPKLLEVQAQLQKPEMISYIEQHPFQITPEIASVAPSLLSSSSLKLNFLKEDPNRIVYLPKEALDEATISYLDSISYIPSRKIYEKFPQLFSIPSLVARSEQEYVDVMVINPFHDYDFKDIFLLVDSNYQFKESDFSKNPNLRKYAKIMEIAVQQNPSFIRFIGPDVMLSGPVLKQVLDQFPITKEVLEENPDLIQNDYLMSYLVFRDFHLKNYHLNFNERQMLIKSALKEKKYDDLLDLPFMKPPFQKRFQPSSLRPLLPYINVEIDYDDVDTQMKYQQLLNQLFFIQAEINYQQNKFHFLYPDVASMNLAFQNAFKNHQEDSLLIDLDHFINQGEKVITIGELSSLVKVVKQKQEKNGTFYIPDITSIYSYLLNLHRNVYLSQNVNLMKKLVIKDLELSAKAENKVKMGKYIHQIQKKFQNHRWENYGGYHFLKKKLESIRKDVLKMYYVRKRLLSFTDDEFEQLEDLCLNGNLTLKAVTDILQSSDDKVNLEVFRYYNQFYTTFPKDKIISEFSVTMSDKEKFPYHYQNYQIANEKHFLYVLQLFFSKLMEKDIPNILNTFSHFPKIALLLPLVNLVPFFSIDEYLSILTHYSEIYQRLMEDASAKNLYQNNPLLYLIGHMRQVVSLASGLDESKKEVYSLVLGKDVASSLSSQLLPEYMKVYIESLLRGQSSIPQVSGVNGNFSYSTLTTEPDSLLIGTNFAKSCIDLTNVSGASTYRGCLTKPNMDVLLIRNKFTHEIVARSILFRTKNIVMMAPIYDTSGQVFEPLLSDSFLNQVGNDIMKQSEQKNDFIDAVLYNCGLLVVSDLHFPIIEDDRLLIDFPHADLGSQAFVLNTSKRCVNGFKSDDIDTSTFTKQIYERFRKPVKHKEDITVYDLKRIQVLNAMMNSENREETNKPIFIDDFETLFCGEDWYAGKRKNGQIDCVMLPTVDIRVPVEMSLANLLLSNSNNDKQIK